VDSRSGGLKPCVSSHCVSLRHDLRQLREIGPLIKRICLLLLSDLSTILDRPELKQVKLMIPSLSVNWLVNHFLSLAEVFLLKGETNEEALEEAKKLKEIRESSHDQPTHPSCSLELWIFDLVRRGPV
jgi:hypothetical protein